MSSPRWRRREVASVVGGLNVTVAVEAVWSADKRVRAELPDDVVLRQLTPVIVSHLETCGFA